MQVALPPLDGSDVLRGAVCQHLLAKQWIGEVQHVWTQPWWRSEMQGPQDACVAHARSYLGLTYLECSFCECPHPFTHCTGKSHSRKVWERWERLKASGVTYGVGRQEFWQYWCERLAYNHLDGEIRLIPLTSVRQSPPRVHQSLSINVHHQCLHQWLNFDHPPTPLSHASPFATLPQSSPSETLLASDRSSINAGASPWKEFLVTSPDELRRILKGLLEMHHESQDFTPMKITLQPAKQALAEAARQEVLWKEVF